MCIIPLSWICWRPITGILVITERNSRKKVNHNYLGNQEHFFEVLLHFWNLHKILSVLKKKIIFRTQTFSKLLSSKNVVAWMTERFSLRTPFESQSVKWPETVLKSACQHFYNNFLLRSNKLSSVLCLLVRAEIWGPLSNMLTADEKYSSQNWEKFKQQVQPQFSSKPKTFFASFIAFLILT